MINFITKKSMTEGQLTVGGSSPTHAGGGDTSNFSGSWGFGDLAQIVSMCSAWSVMTNSRASRPATATTPTTITPGKGLDYSSGIASSPANYSQGSNATNPLAASGCNAFGVNLAQWHLPPVVMELPDRSRKPRRSRFLARPLASWPTTIASASNTSGT